MTKVVLYGAGKKLKTVLSLINDGIIIVAVVDKDKRKQGKILLEGRLEVLPVEKLKDLEFDYIVVTVQKDASIEELLQGMGLLDRTIFFWRDSIAEKTHIFGNRILKGFDEAQLYCARLDSAPYEWGYKQIPCIHSSEELLKKISVDRSSLCRFGDAEFDIILGRNSPWYQENDDYLAKRLYEVLISTDNKINVAIAQNFILKDYIEPAADEIRIYMKGVVRQKIIALLSSKVTYYDAYVTRPYYIYKDKKHAEEIFHLFKNIWRNRKICLVEGAKGRFGLGNDLLNEAKEVIRVVCPAVNAWNRYSDIFQYIKSNITKDYLILISLGPTAKVLAYDLAEGGYQAIDIGQLDNEYDWYARGANTRTSICGKMVAECNFSPDAVVPNNQIEEIFHKQVVQDFS